MMFSRLWITISDDDFEEISDFMVQDFEDMQTSESVEEDCGCDAWEEEHPKELLMKSKPDAGRCALGDYTAIDDWRKNKLRIFIVEGVQEQEDEEYDLPE